MEELLNLNKEYLGTMKLGETTPSYDRELEVDNTYPFDHISENDIYNLAKIYRSSRAVSSSLFCS